MTLPLIRNLFVIMFTYRPEISCTIEEESEEESEIALAEMTSKHEKKSSKREQEIKLLHACCQRT